MFTLFIDTNIYLGFYDQNVPKFKEMLNTLVGLKEHIFVTEQMVNEVRRNQVRLVSSTLNKRSDFQLKGIRHLGQFDERGNIGIDNSNTKFKLIRKQIDELTAEYEQNSETLLRQVAKIKDDVSTSLNVIFKYAHLATNEQLKRARLRKELGRPPGKYNDPLGDQISWEQFLDHYDGKSLVIIVTNDRDFYVEHSKSVTLLNADLYNDLCLKSNNGEPKVEIFKQLSDALQYCKNLLETAGVDFPDDKALALIRKEEQEFLSPKEKAYYTTKLHRAHFGKEFGELASLVGLFRLMFEKENTMRDLNLKNDEELSEYMQALIESQREQ